MTRPDTPSSELPGHRRIGRQWIFTVLAGVVVLAGLSCFAHAQETTTRPAERKLRPVPPARARKAMQRGLTFLRAARKQDGTWSAPQARQYSGGLTALVLRAARAADVDANDPMFVSSMETMLRVQPEWTYALAMRLALLAEVDANAYTETIAADAARLRTIQNSTTGGWGYGSGHPTTMQDRSYVDSSNTLLAVSALADAAAGGFTVPEETRNRAIHFWTYSQNDDGGWGYLPPGTESFRVKPSSYGTTVAGGLVSLMRLTDLWARGNPLPTEGAPTRKQVSAARDWLAKHYSVTEIPQYLWGKNNAFYYHYLWMLARAGNELGTERFGRQPRWRHDLARTLIAQQLPDGSWIAPNPGDATKAPEGSDAVICTALAMLALEESQKPVLLHQLRFDGGWSGNFRAAATVARFYDTHIGPATWRTATPKTGLAQLRRAPLLLLDATGDVALDDALSQRLRRYVHCGGTMLVQAREPGSQFNTQLMEYLKGIFPECTARQIATDHPVFSARFRLDPLVQPRLVGLSSGGQVRVFVSVSDIAGRLHGAPASEGAVARRLLTNLALYATDGAGPTHGHIGRAEPKESKVRRRITIGRGKHQGDWNTCDAAVDRLSADLANAISIGLREKVIPLNRPIPEDLPLLWVAGNKPAKLSDVERKHIKAYVEAGGTVLIDPAAGRNAFYRDLTAALKATEGLDNLRPIKPTHPVLTGKLAGGLGSDLGRVRYSRAVREEKPQLHSPVLLGVEHEGRLGVIVSRYGIACGLEALPTWNARTLAPEDARRLAMNVLLYALSNEE